jgi:predicted O-methyltransferase YrrM
MKNRLLKLLDFLLGPFTLLSAFWLRFVRKNIVGFWTDSSWVSKKIFYRMGVFPILDHYYEPLFNPSRLRKPLQNDRNLPGLDLNVSGQLAELKGFSFNDEILEILARPSHQLTFSFNQSSFLSGDAEYLYNIIRKHKPSKIIEIGCGFSTLMIQHAIDKNKRENSTCKCEHLCIEPYEITWLESLPVTVVRDIVEKADITLFTSLGENDILFIDSSHIIRPQGDVLTEYLEILPVLSPGVLVHIHDIFTPKDYLPEWLKKGTVFWNEQYLVEAFLSFNDRFKVVGALNFLKHHFYAELSEKCPLLSKEREPGSFWIQRVK